MAKKNSYIDLKNNYEGYLILIKAGCFYEAREECAKIISKYFDYKLYEENYSSFSRLKTGFPVSALGSILEKLKEEKINYIIVENYEIIEEFSNGKTLKESTIQSIKTIKSIVKILDKPVINGGIKKIDEGCNCELKNTVLKSMVDEADAIKIFEINNNEEMDYDAKLSMLQMEFGEIQEVHTNFEGLGKYGELTQYILEAYYEVNKYTSRKWISERKINLDLLVADAEPIEFCTVRRNGHNSIYKLYNSSQTQEYQQKYNISLSTSEPEVIVSKKDLIDAVINFLCKYDGIYGRIAVVKILTGECENDDLENIQQIKAGGFYGKLPSRYGNVLNDIIGKLLKSNRIAQNLKYKLIYTSPTDKEQPKEDDKDFKKIIQLIKQGRNIFVTGNAGTGKSYLLNKLKSKYKKRLELTSTTGLAAVNIKGITIHSWAGVGLCKKDIAKCVSDILEKNSLTKKIRNCEMLAIDEISMLKGHTFSYIDQILRMIRESDEPFGGIQLLLFGDFFQLPPIEVSEVDKEFCFESQTWQDLNLEIVKLETIYRQTELPFIKALNNIRVDKIDEDDIQLLMSREITYDTSDSNMLHIFAKNDETNSYNASKFNSLESKMYKYTSTLGVYRGNNFIQCNLNERENLILSGFKKNCRAEENLCLKKGCRVMLLINLDFDKGLINGSCGEITSLDNDKVIVLFDNGVETSIEPNKFEYYYNDSLQASMTQYPLKLAYAITIHKSQGMTLDNVVVDCNKIFEEGQAYVALSRVRCSKGLYLRNFSPQKVKVNSKVIEFYNKLNDKNYQVAL